MIRAFQTVLLLIFLSGCAFHTKPYATYHDDKRPLADTSVFSTMGMKGNALGQIISVDGKNTSCAQAGCPIWVRVIPGDHAFKLRLSIYDGVSKYRQGEADFVIKDMKPRHVYEAQYVMEGDHFQVSPIDLGEDPEYGVTLGKKGINQKFHRVSFE